MNFKKLGNLISKEYDMADDMIKSSKVLSKTNLSIQDVYKERSHEKEGTYIVTLSAEQINESIYDEFVDNLKHHIRYSDYVDSNFVIPTINEFIERKYEDGRKIGKVMRKANVSDRLIDRFSEYDIVKSKDVYLTVTGAPQFMVGVSAFSTNNWDSYSGSSCLDVTKNEPNQIHVLGLLNSPRFLVAFTHDNPDQLTLEENRRIMQTRVLLFIDDEGQLHYNYKAYGSTNIDKKMIRDCLSSTGIAVGIDKYIDDDMIDEDDWNYTMEYLSEVDESYDIKVIENVFEPIKLNLTGHFKFTGTSLFKDTSRENGEVVCTCPACQIPNDDKSAIVKEIDFSAFKPLFHPDSTGHLGLDNKRVEIEKCFLCDGTKEITLEKQKYGFDDFYYHIKGKNSFGDHLSGSYSGGDTIRFYSEYVKTDLTVEYTVPVSMYPEGSFFDKDQNDFILIYKNAELVTEKEVVENKKVEDYMELQHTLEGNHTIQVSSDVHARIFFGGEEFSLSEEWLDYLENINTEG